MPKMAKLTEEQISSMLDEAAGWSREDDKWIAKSYRFADYLDGIDFVRDMARIAELELNHHPMISIDYKLVRVRLTSWRAGGLTALDFEAAARFDALFAQSRS